MKWFRMTGTQVTWDPLCARGRQGYVIAAPERSTAIRDGSLVQSIPAGQDGHSGRHLEGTVFQG